ncbi:MAG: hypothetical protein ACREVL_02040 [Solimonas sp.]
MSLVGIVLLVVAVAAAGIVREFRRAQDGSSPPKADKGGVADIDNSGIETRTNDWSPFGHDAGDGSGGDAGSGH